MRATFSCILFLLVGFTCNAQAVDFITDLNNPKDMELDGSILYVAEQDAFRIIKIDLSRPDPEIEVVLEGVPVVCGLAIKGNELFYSQLNGVSTVSKIDLTDPVPFPVIVLGNFPSAFDLEFYGNELYIAQLGADKIVKIDPSIQNPPIIDVVTDLETPIGLEVIGDELYVSRYVTNYLSKIDLTDPNPVAVNVLGGLLLPRGLTHRGDELYIGEAGQSINQDRISKIDYTMANPTRQTVVDGLWNPTLGLEIYEDVLYIAEDFKISSFDLNPLSIDDFDANAVTLYPNPSSDFVELSGFTSPMNYTLYDVTGIILEQGEATSNQKIDIQKLAAGTYFLQLGNGAVQKFVKQ